MVLTILGNGLKKHAASAEGKSALPVGLTKDGQSPQVQLHPFKADDQQGLIVKVQPPKEPVNRELHHVPCDIVLCIDVSSSMAAAAPAPATSDGDREDTGLRVLDLVKHAARTILETLDERDRLGLVTFSEEAEIIQDLTPVTAKNKADLVKKINGLQVISLTNLWGGIRQSLQLFAAKSEGRVPALLILTDGIPNHQCPPRGYIPKLQSMGPLPATIHTFGFGYHLRSGLLKSIAEFGGGNYSFIPDAGMVGTVFIHAVANLQSTFANNAKLRLTYPSYLRLEEMTGEAVGRQTPVKLQGDLPEPMTSLTIALGNIQFGQSRDIYLRYGHDRADPRDPPASEAEGQGPPIITAVLEYQHFTPTVHQVVAHQDPFSVSPSIPAAEIAYHMSRAAVVAFLSTICPLNPQLEHVPLIHERRPQDLPQQLRSLVAALAAARPEFVGSHDGCRALLTDLCGNPAAAAQAADPATWTGQVALALVDSDHYHRWGIHYLPSLAGAHARQVCNSFKDAGPMRYGVDSPLFQRCRDRLDDAFDNLPPPEPAQTHSPSSSPGRRPRRAASPHSRVTSMRRYNNAMNGCFAAESPVLLAAAGGALAGKVARIAQLRRGMEVVTPRGPRKVVKVLRMPVRGVEMCVVVGGGGGQRAPVLVTPWHPVALPEGGGGWQFPRDVALRSVRYTGAVYSVLLERDEDVDAHAMLVGGVWGVTMGHGLTREDGRRDVRAHRFYGDYNQVRRALAKLPEQPGGLVTGGGLTRDPETGLVNGFSAPRRRQVKSLTGAQRKDVAVLSA
ncbi:hypothetical protein VTH06DRAFT_7232 [Thermothelomyces fergusii]